MCTFPLFLMMNSCCSNTYCALVNKIILLLLTLTELAAVVAVYKSHFGTGGASFGSTTGSLSIIALAINSAVWMKFGSAHCGACQKKK